MHLARVATGPVPCIRSSGRCRSCSSGATAARARERVEPFEEHHAVLRVGRRLNLAVTQVLVEFSVGAQRQ